MLLPAVNLQSRGCLRRKLLPAQRTAPAHGGFLRAVSSISLAVEKRYRFHGPNDEQNRSTGTDAELEIFHRNSFE